MDKRLIVADERRILVGGITSDTPLVTLAWRAMRTEHQRRSEERRQTDHDLKKMREALAVIAQEVFRLRRSVAGSQAHQCNKENGENQVVTVVERIEEALAAAGVEIVAPAGQPYTPELRELLDNIAQRPEPDLSELRIAEVLTPAITYRGKVLKMGKAVIAVPAQGSGSVNAEGIEQKRAT